MSHRRLSLVLCAALGACSGSEGGTDPGPGSDAGVESGDAEFPSPAACEFDLAAALPPRAPSSAPFVVGGFRVVVSSGGGVDVRHSDEPDRSIFAVPDNGWAAMKASPGLIEGQGSVQVHESIHATCAAAGPVEARSDGVNLVLSGPLGGTDPSCAGTSWEVRLCEPRPHHLRAALRAPGGGFDALGFSTTLLDPDERVVGMGEQFPWTKLDLRGRTIPVVVREQGIGRGQPAISVVMEALSPGSSGDEAATYAPMPHILTSAARSFVLEDPEVSVFDIGASIAVRVYAADATIRVLHGRGPLELIERLTEFTGRMPEPPAWIDGGAIVALAGDFAGNPGRLDKLLAHGAAVSAVWTQTWCGTTKTLLGDRVTWNWVAQPGWSGEVSALAERGQRALCYVNPMLRDVSADADPPSRNLYREAVDNGYEVHDATGAAYVLRQGTFDVVLLDLSNPDARAWMKSVLKDEVLGAGCSGWMADFGEALPFDAVLASGEPPAAWHDRYPVEWARLNREAVAEAGRQDDVLVFHRSGFTGTSGVAPMLWVGDQTVTWDGYDGLASAVHGLLEGGFSGLALNHSDAGGYTVVPVADPPVQRSAELLMRWVELGAFTTLLRTHEGSAPSQNAQVYDDDASASHFARFSKVYRALATLRRSLFEDASAHGWPVARPLALHHPDLPAAWDVADEFELGPDVLVAPVIEPCTGATDCTVARSLWLPPGDWVHLWTGAHHDGGTAGADVVVDAPLGQPPVFLRAGSASGAQIVQALKAEGLDVPGE